MHSVKSWNRFYPGLRTFKRISSTWPWMKRHLYINDSVIIWIIMVIIRNLLHQSNIEYFWIKLVIKTSNQSRMKNLITVFSVPILYPCLNSFSQDTITKNHPGIRTTSQMDRIWRSGLHFPELHMERTSHSRPTIILTRLQIGHLSGCKIRRCPRRRIPHLYRTCICRKPTCGQALMPHFFHLL